MNNTMNTNKQKKCKVWSLYTLRELRKNDGAFIRKTGLPARKIRYYSLLNDIKLAWLVFTRKADAFIWEDE